METSELWQRFLDDRDPQARERLAAAYLSLVREEVLEWTDHAPGYTDELERCGLIGLVKAIEMFDPDRGVAFEPFARQRIRGAISDDLRLRTVARSRSTARRTHRQKSLPVPSALLADIGAADGGASLQAEVWLAIEALPPEQKVVIGLHYCDGVALEEVARVLEASRRAVRDLRADALESVRTHLSLRAWLPPRKLLGQSSGSPGQPDGEPPARAKT